MPAYPLRKIKGEIMQNEFEIISRAKKGDHIAFEQLVTRYEKKVFSLAMSYVNNEQDAYDICQDVFLRVYRFLPNFSGESQFFTWLFRVSVNVCKDFLRQKSKHSELSIEQSETDENYYPIPGGFTYDPQGELEKIEMQQVIKDAILSLSENYREIIVMRDISGLSYAEISSVLGLELGTVKSRISRARELLQYYLSDFRNNTAKSKSNTMKGGAKNE